MESSILVKAFALLEAMAGCPEGRPLGQLAAAVGTTKPSAHRVLNSLVHLGYIEKAGAGIYRQTPQVSRLLFGAHIRRMLETGEPLLKQLHTDTRETVNLGVLRQTQVFYLLVLESTLPLRRVVESHSADPFYCTALGRAIVSQLPTEDQERLVKLCQPVARTSETVTSKRELKQILAAAARDGYAVEHDQTDLGVSCIGVPVFDEHGVVGAVSLSLPTARAEQKQLSKLISLVRDTADRLSVGLQTAAA